MLRLRLQTACLLAGILAGGCGARSALFGADLSGGGGAALGPTGSGGFGGSVSASASSGLGGSVSASSSSGLGGSVSASSSSGFGGNVSASASSGLGGSGGAGGAGGMGSLMAVNAISLGQYYSCALLDTGHVRCWGQAMWGELGYGNVDNLGDDETPASAGDVDVGGTVVQIAAGHTHACARLDTGSVRCWGTGMWGELGYANTSDIGDDETPASAGDVDVGGTVVQITAGGGHTCALLTTGKVRCWGEGGFGKLGYGNLHHIGDDEPPSSAGDVDVGGTVVQIAAGYTHTCALLTTGKVRCWGDGQFGQLGYGNTRAIGDDETPASAGDVDVGETVLQIAAGGDDTCALLATGKVRCWGYGGWGQLGYANTDNIGDDETPASVGDIDVGGKAVQVTAGYTHNCAVLEGGEVRCWGQGLFGKLGYESTDSVGDADTPAAAGSVEVGGAVTRIAAGGAHTCALLTTGKVRCWGSGASGDLGYGNKNDIGDDETPASAGDAAVF